MCVFIPGTEGNLFRDTSNPFKSEMVKRHFTRPHLQKVSPVTPGPTKVGCIFVFDTH